MRIERGIVSIGIDELADRRRRKREVAAFVDQLQSALHGVLTEAYQGPGHPDSVRRQAARAAYHREMAAWDDELRLVYRERDRWADDGGAPCE